MGLDRYEGWEGGREGREGREGRREKMTEQLGKQVSKGRRQEWRKGGMS